MHHMRYRQLLLGAKSPGAWALTDCQNNTQWPSCVTVYTTLCMKTNEKGSQQAAQAWVLP